MLRSCENGKKACLQCDVYNALRAADEKKAVCYSCYAGLHEIVVPVFDEKENYIGCMTSGQFHLSGTPLFTQRKILALAEQYGLDGNELYNAYKMSNSLAPVQVEGIIAYLGIIGRQLTSIREHLIFMDKINVPDKISMVKKYIDENFDSPLTIEQVAKKFNISPSNLAHKFTETVNVSFQRYVNFRRLMRAKEMLHGTTLSVSEIAYACGFGSVSQFNRTFKASAGCSPSCYREQNNSL